VAHFCTHSQGHKNQRQGETEVENSDDKGDGYDYECRRCSDEYSFVQQHISKHRDDQKNVVKSTRQKMLRTELICLLMFLYRKPLYLKVLLFIRELILKQCKKLLIFLSKQLLLNICKKSFSVSLQSLCSKISLIFLHKAVD
jgi:hypothetical protein